MSALPNVTTPSQRRRPAKITAELEQPLLALVDDNLDDELAREMIPMLAVTALIWQREREWKSIIATLAQVMTLRDRLRKNPPDEVCYAAGAAIAALHSYGWLLDEWAFFRSQIRNWMIGNGFNDITCKIVGQRVRARLSSDSMLVCRCHAIAASACETIVADVAAGRAVALDSITLDPHLTVSLITD